METEEINWERITDIQSKTDGEDEYSSMVWGCPEDIDYLIEVIYQLKEKQTNKEIISIFGLSFIELQKRIDFFNKHKYEFSEEETKIA